MPPCARLVLVSLGSVARVTSVTAIPASARHRATVPPATPQPRISTSVSMHALMRLPLWKACVNLTQARLRQPRSLRLGPWTIPSSMISSSALRHEFVRRRCSPYARLLDHLVRPEEEHRGNGQAQRLGGFEVDDQLKAHRLLHRQVSGPGAFED